jgi:hypothetical protein
MVEQELVVLLPEINLENFYLNVSMKQKLQTNQFLKILMMA